MRLTCMYNVRTGGVEKRGSDERIVATYSNKTKMTTLTVDADIVTIGLVAQLLQEQYNSFLAGKPDMKERIDAAIAAALKGD